jgi:hypothetical protein
VTSPIGRIEVFGPILNPDREGPHTHLLRSILHIARNSSAALRCPRVMQVELVSFPCREAARKSALLKSANRAARLPAVNRLAQRRRFKAVLNELAFIGEPLNRVLEVDLDGDGMTLTLYDLPSG